MNWYAGPWPWSPSIQRPPGISATRRDNASALVVRNAMCAIPDVGASVSLSE